MMEEDRRSSLEILPFHPTDFLSSTRIPLTTIVENGVWEEEIARPAEHNIMTSQSGKKDGEYFWY